ncbi:MAG: hypothetical protein KKB05_03850 [Proteobacteria bacterium]|nr:hypothetical protein [Pseudomonadota bacterium]
MVLIISHHFLSTRKEVLKRLLKLNHEIHEQEVKAGLYAKGKTKKKQKADTSKQIKLF